MCAVYSLLSRGLGATAVVGLLITLLGVPAAASGVGQRALWIWHRPSPRSLVSFAADRGVADLFVAVPTDVSPVLDWYADLRRRADAAGLRVHALGGDPGWVDEPSAALAWQRQAVATGLFDGVHVDVEPWLHPHWSTDRDAVVRRYLQVLGLLAADTSLPFEADVAFWLHELTTPAGVRLDEAVLSLVDAVTVMSYRDTATGVDSITGTGAATLAAAAAAGKRARLAVETRFLGEDPVAQKQTFHGETRRHLDTVLAEVDAAMADHPSYAGIAVHDRAGWAAMRR